MNRYQTIGPFTTSSVPAGDTLQLDIDATLAGFSLPASFNIVKAVIVPSNDGLYDARICVNANYAINQRLIRWEGQAGTVYYPFDRTGGGYAEGLQGFPMPYDEVNGLEQLHLEIENVSAIAATYTYTFQIEEVPVFNSVGAVTFRNTVINNVADPVAFTAGLGVGSGLFAADFTNSPHTFQYIGCGGLARVANTTGTAIDFEAYGVQASTRISSLNTGVMDNNTSGINGLQASWKSEPGATGTINLLGAINAAGTAAAVGLTVTTAYGVKIQGLFGTGAITNYAGFWTSSATQTYATNNTHVLIGATSVPSGNWAIYDNSGLNSFFTGSVTVVKSIITSGVLTTGSMAESISATLAASAVNESGVNITIASGTGTAGNRTGSFLTLTAGFTADAQTRAISAGNSVAGIGTGLFTNAGGGNGNMGIRATATATTVGNNTGAVLNASASSSLNVGAICGATSATNTPPLNIGVAAFALNATVNVVGFFGFMVVAPATLTQAVIVSDNGATASPLFIGRNAGVMTFTIFGNGALYCRSSVPTLTDNNSYSVYLDEVGNSAKIICRYSSGTVKTGTVALS